MRSDVEEIKERLRMADIASLYVKLQPAGRNLKGRSPFTNERTPSFFVSPDKDLFHCFSSGKGGDIFTFIQEVEGLDFPGSLKFLADKAGVTLSDRPQQSSNQKSKLLRVVEFATKWYQAQLERNSEAVAYLHDRGLSEETIENFRIGYAPAGWSRLFDAFVHKKVPKQFIEQTGLSQRGERGWYDRFRDRIMFPLMDTQGRPVGFTGRIFLPNDPEAAKKQAKYINSPETRLYHKSRILYGFHLAKRSLITEPAAIVVEGQMDVVMAHQAGLQQTVALSGTALSTDQIELLQRFTQKMVLALDADRAGLEATTKTVHQAYRMGMEVAVALLPDGQDPADMIKADPESFKASIASAQDYVLFRLQVHGDAIERESVRADIYPYVASMTGILDQDQALKHIAAALSLSHEAVRADFAQWRSSYTPEVSTVQKPANQIAAVARNLDDQWLALYLLAEGHTELQELRDKLQQQFTELFDVDHFTGLITEAKARQEALLSQYVLFLDHESDQAIGTALEMSFGRYLQKTYEKELEQIVSRLRQAERNQDEVQILELSQRAQQLNKKLDEQRKQLLA